MRALAADLDVPLGAVLEGGYELDALARSVAVTLAELALVERADSLTD
jgi:acetoin utilization deacetylase AcuC-like enzyme